MIPKKIHFCWFSEDPFPKKIQNCFESWKKHLRDYEQIHWTKEKALNLNIPWVTKAIQEKKWAFAADAVRLYAIWEQGGIYLDADVESLKSFDALLNEESFFCYENGSRRIEGAVFGAEPKNPSIQKALEFYQNKEFKYSEENLDDFILPKILQEAFSKVSPKTIFPEEYFSPKNYYNGKIKITTNTFCIHHFESSWRPQVLQNHIRQRIKLFQKFPAPIAKILNIPLSLHANIKSIGIKATFKKLKK